MSESNPRANYCTVIEHGEYSNATTLFRTMLDALLYVRDRTYGHAPRLGQENRIDVYDDDTFLTYSYSDGNRPNAVTIADAAKRFFGGASGTREGS